MTVGTVGPLRAASLGALPSTWTRRSQPLTPSGWNTIYAGQPNSGTYLLICWKVLSFADVTSGNVAVTGFAGNSKQAVYVYRGPTNLTLTASDVSSGFGTAVAAALAAGAGITLSTASGVTTISGSGSLAFGYFPPTTENSDFVASSCTSYQFRKQVVDSSRAGGAAVDTIYIHQKGISTGL